MLGSEADRVQSAMVGEARKSITPGLPLLKYLGYAFAGLELCRFRHLTTLPMSNRG